MVRLINLSIFGKNTFSILNAYKNITIRQINPGYHTKFIHQYDVLVTKHRLRKNTKKTANENEDLLD